MRLCCAFADEPGFLKHQLELLLGFIIVATVVNGDGRLHDAVVQSRNLVLAIIYRRLEQNDVFGEEIRQLTCRNLFETALAHLVVGRTYGFAVVFKSLDAPFGIGKHVINGKPDEGVNILAMSIPADEVNNLLGQITFCNAERGYVFSCHLFFLHRFEQSLIPVVNIDNKLFGLFATEQEHMKCHGRYFKSAHTAGWNGLYHIPVILNHRQQWGRAPFIAYEHFHLVVFQYIVSVSVHDIWIVCRIGVVSFHDLKIANTNAAIAESSVFLLSHRFNLFQSSETVERLFYHPHSCLTVDAGLVGFEQIAQFPHVDMETDVVEQLAVVNILQQQWHEPVGATLHKHLVVVVGNNSESRLLFSREGSEQFVRTTLHLIQHIHSHRLVALFRVDAVFGQFDAVYAKRTDDDASLF